jgi:acyl-CoA thioester hydrolase
MKPPTISTSDVTTLPFVYTLTIPDAYRDENGHMNMRWYLHIYDDAGYPLFALFGLTPEYHQQHGTGGYDLEHHIHYLREIYAEDTVEVYARVLARSAKRVHYMMFMVNQTQGTVASTFECVNAFADLSVRRMAPFPDDVASRIDGVIAQHRLLDWEAPTCGSMGA